MALLFQAVFLAATTLSAASADSLPQRSSPIPRTTDSVPHVQIDTEAPPEISAALLQRVSHIPNVEIRDTIISLPGALGFWITDEQPLARPEAIVRGREFAHLHPDGSLHASLSPELSREAVQTGWATHHPWADQRPGWEGFVMIYSPASTDEIETVFRLILASFDYVTGQDLASETK